MSFLEQKPFPLRKSLWPKGSTRWNNLWKLKIRFSSLTHPLPWGSFLTQKNLGSAFSISKSETDTTSMTLERLWLKWVITGSTRSTKPFSLPLVVTSSTSSPLTIQTQSESNSLTMRLSPSKTSQFLHNYQQILCKTRIFCLRPMSFYQMSRSLLLSKELLKFCLVTASTFPHLLLKPLRTTLTEISKTLRTESIALTSISISGSLSTRIRTSSLISNPL